MKRFLLLLICIYSICLFSQEKPNYPEPKEGFKRIDLIFPKIDSSKNYKVEIKFSFEFNTYHCANTSFNFRKNNLVEKYAIKPIRYPYYELEDDLIEIAEGIPNNCEKKKKEKRKIYSDTSYLREYNSYFSIPYYIPQNWNIEYRLWKTEDHFETIKE